LGGNRGVTLRERRRRTSKCGAKRGGRRCGLEMMLEKI
jgi:hypothetical protein